MIMKYLWQLHMLYEKKIEYFYTENMVFSNLTADSLDIRIAFLDMSFSFNL